jgi:malate synthase
MDLQEVPMQMDVSEFHPQIPNSSLGPSAGTLFTPDAKEFLSALHVEFESRRRALLSERKVRAEQLKRGGVIDFPAETEVTRLSTWRVAHTPPDLADRRVEITGPVDAKMIINALNSGAKVFMADLEDATSPTWSNIVQGHLNLQQAVRRTLKFESDGKSYALKDKLATLVVRPRGWHLEERHFKINGEPISASLFDFGLYFFHNANELLERGSGPYFYLPKLESRHEAKLWNDVFKFAQERLKIHPGTIRATVLLETITAAFEMEEILFELREHASGLNAGRWDYLFSMIKKFSHRGDIVFPDRAELTMTVPFMRAYTNLLVETCHKRGAHAIGGMSAFIPSRRDAEVNARAMAKVQEDKQREAGNGFDGTWVAHPDLVPVAQAEFDKVLGGHAHQKHRRPPADVSSAMLWPRTIEGAGVTIEGLRNNLNVALIYISSWLQGLGAVAIHNLMEDAATAEIARAELWHWVHHRQEMKDGTVITPELFEVELDAEFKKLCGTTAPPTLLQARKILLDLVLDTDFTEFLTLPAYQILEEAT